MPTISTIPSTTPTPQKAASTNTPSPHKLSRFWWVNVASQEILSGLKTLPSSMESPLLPILGHHPLNLKPNFHKNPSKLFKILLAHWTQPDAYYRLPTQLFRWTIWDMYRLLLSIVRNLPNRNTSMYLTQTTTVWRSFPFQIMRWQLWQENVELQGF